MVPERMFWIGSPEPAPWTRSEPLQEADKSDTTDYWARVKHDTPSMFSMDSETPQEKKPGITTYIPILKPQPSTIHRLEENT